MVFASIVSMMYSQFCPGFTLVKKNFLIAIASISGSLVGVAINYLFMRQFGFITAGVAQFFSYFVMVAILYSVGKKLKIIKYNIANSLLLAGVLLLYVALFLIFKDQIIHLNIYIPILFSIAVATIIALIYFKQQNLAIADLVSKVKNQLKRK